MAGRWICALAFPLAFVSAVGAQEDRGGFYGGLQLGAADPSATRSSLGGVNHPTRCDVLLYPASVSPPANDPACMDDTPTLILSNRFRPDQGLASGLVVGYAMASGLRLELEYLNRYLGDDTVEFGATDDEALRSKTSEWSAEQPPHEWVGDVKAHQVLVNAYYDLRNRSRFTPYIGFGAGMAATNLSYYVQFVRKPEAEYLALVFDPDWPEDAKRAAAGTVSIIDTTVSRDLLGYQALAGVDYALSERTSFGITLRWARFEDLEEGTTWNIIRSHEPVQADGITPFDADLKFEGIGYEAVTFSLKHHF